MSELNPMLKPGTAYQALEENQFRAELELLDRYQAFSAELLRLSLAGIAVIGFLYKEAFAAFDPAKHPAISIAAVEKLCAWSILFFAVSAIFALVFRYFSNEAFRLYTEGLRFKSDSKKVAFKLRRRDCVLVVCIISKAGAAAFLGVGALLLSLGFVRLLGL